MRPTARALYESLRTKKEKNMKAGTEFEVSGVKLRAEVGAPGEGCLGCAGIDRDAEGNRKVRCGDLPECDASMTEEGKELRFVEVKS